MDQIPIIQYNEVLNSKALIYEQWRRVKKENEELLKILEVYKSKVKDLETVKKELQEIAEFIKTELT